MKQIYLRILRDRNATLDEYRKASDQLASVLAIESAHRIPVKQVPVETPLGSAMGTEFRNEIILVPILRSGLTMLAPFLLFYPKARVGFLGIARDEKTAIPELYYSKLPSFHKDQTVFILDPMVATGGSASMAIRILKEAGASESQITLIGFIAAPEGVARLQSEYRDLTLMIAQVDERLNAKKYIIPGLGDFGDRFFGN